MEPIVQARIIGTTSLDPIPRHAYSVMFGDDASVVLAVGPDVGDCG